jgi:hypothetical protein
VRVALALALALAPALAGCASKAPDAPALVPYPRLGDAVAYAASGAYVEFARWENGHPFATGAGRVRFEVGAAPKVIDGARQVHAAFRVATTVDGAKHAELFVAPEHEAIAQSVYPLSRDQSVVAFDERGLPWLFGASALFGRDLGARTEFAVGSATLAWVPDGREGDAVRMKLAGSPALEGELWMQPGSPWPLRASLAIRDASLAPAIRVDGAYPASMVAERADATLGSGEIPPRSSAARFGDDASVQRVAWDGEKPPDGAAGYVLYALADAARDAKLLDKGLADWLAAAGDPRVYRATFKMIPLNGTGPLNDTLVPYWLIEWMEKGGKFYQVEIERVDAPPAPLPLPLPATGAPRVLSSGPAEAPKDASHGWFPKDAEPDRLVPLSEGVRVVRATFGAQGIQIFLRSFANPPGYAYFLDGGWDKSEADRYTVVYDPAAGLIQEATGRVTVRLAPVTS